MKQWMRNRSRRSRKSYELINTPSRNPPDWVTAGTCVVHPSIKTDDMEVSCAYVLTPDVPTSKRIHIAYVGERGVWHEALVWKNRIRG